MKQTLIGSPRTGRQIASQTRSGLTRQNSRADCVSILYPYNDLPLTMIESHPLRQDVLWRYECNVKTEESEAGNSAWTSITVRAILRPHYTAPISAGRNNAEAGNSSRTGMSTSPLLLHLCKQTAQGHGQSGATDGYRSSYRSRPMPDYQRTR